MPVTRPFINAPPPECIKTAAAAAAGGVCGRGREMKASSGRTILVAFFFVAAAAARCCSVELWNRIKTYAYADDYLGVNITSVFASAHSFVVMHSFGV